jgi:putative aminopeptidase FrvX
MAKTTLPTIDGRFMVDVTADLCRIPSPTGFTDDAVAFVETHLATLGLNYRKTIKGSLVATLPGGAESHGGERVLSAHVDTLGAMVREIKKNGRLRLTLIGGFDWSTIEGEYCLVHSAKGTTTGTILTTKASFHVHGKAAADLKRDDQSMEIRLDEQVSTAEDVRALGIEVGDFVSFDPRTTITPNGFIKSRHLDDKACVAILIGVAKALVDGDVKMAVPSYLYVSTYEEVGHGTSAGLPDGVDEVIAVDMAAVGEGQTSTEFKATICVKDGTGPYDHALSRRLIELATTNGIDHAIDIYTYYGSDVSQALRAGYDIRGGLVGPGVDGSHSYERLHQSSLEETAKLLLAYLLSDERRAS